MFRSWDPEAIFDNEEDRIRRRHERIPEYTVEEPLPLTRVERGYSYYWSSLIQHQNKQGHICKVIKNLSKGRVRIMFRDSTTIDTSICNIATLPE